MPKQRLYEKDEERSYGVSSRYECSNQAHSAIPRDGKDTFFQDEKTQDAVIRQFSVLGEAASKIPTSIRVRHKNIPWKNMIGMRNIIIHDYAETDLPTIWNTIAKELHPLEDALKTILKKSEAC